MDKKKLHLLMTGFDGDYELFSEVPRDEFDTLHGVVWLAIEGNLGDRPMTLQSVLIRMPEAEWVEIEPDAVGGGKG